MKSKLTCMHKGCVNVLIVISHKSKHSFSIPIEKIEDFEEEVPRQIFVSWERSLTSKLWFFSLLYNVIILKVLSSWRFNLDNHFSSYKYHKLTTEKGKFDLEFQMTPKNQLRKNGLSVHNQKTLWNHKKSKFLSCWSSKSNQ